MDFCKKCGSLIIPKNGKLKCKCGFEGKTDSDEEYIIKADKNPENNVVVTDKNSVALPTTKITCYKCGGTKGYWWTLQTRSADEAATYFIRCTNCGNTWRRSN